MTRADVNKLLALRSIDFPHEKRAEGNDLAIQINAWHQLLEPLDTKAVLEAYTRLVAKGREFAPNRGQLYQEVVALSRPALPTAEEAWEELRDNMRRFGYYAQSEGLAALSPHAREAAKCLGYADLCAGENLVADRAHFIRAYSTLVEREETETALPPALRRELPGDSTAVGKGTRTAALEGQKGLRRVQ